MYQNKNRYIHVNFRTFVELLIWVLAGGAFGLLAGAWVVGMSGCSLPALPLVWAVVGAIAAARVGPKILRDIEKDGRDGHSSRRH